MGVEDGFTCGKQLYYQLLERKYPTEPIPDYDLADKIYHLAHATMVLNPEFTVRKRTEVKCLRQLKSILGSPEVKGILEDASLDS
jgi:hypothetical protein